jgi:hypothetical protein
MGTLVCLTRHKESLVRIYESRNDAIKIVEADVNDYFQLVKAMSGVTIAFYLIHSMDGSSKEWKRFAERDRTAAGNFAKAATKCGFDRIIYLGGLARRETEEDSKLSQHIRSRKEVGDILRTCYIFPRSSYLRARRRLVSDAGIFGEKVASNGMSEMGLD